ncbi:MAG: zinc ribbon domain-containing protein [Eubacteriales bacterium]|nr:zinc ribbon domain-containing protein [Eubacteriales bacterium]
MYCEKCGEKLEDTAVFCPVCSNQVKRVIKNGENASDSLIWEDDTYKVPDEAVDNSDREGHNRLKWALSISLSILFLIITVIIVWIMVSGSGNTNNTGIVVKTEKSAMAGAEDYRDEVKLCCQKIC